VLWNLDDTLHNADQLKTLSNAMKGDREAFLQLLLSLCNNKTLNRIVNCPTYPLRVITPDLQERLNLFKSVYQSNSPFEISNILSILYESAGEKKYRKGHGQFFTSTTIAEKAIEHSKLENGEVILDPGCGTGIFPTTILKRLIDKSQHASSITYFGIENDALLALSTAISLDFVSAPERWRVIYANFLLLNPRYLERFGCSKVDTIISNPPFVRFHRLDKRENLTAKLGISQFSGLHSFFLARSAMLEPEMMIFILPPEMFGTNYGSELLGKLSGNYEFSERGIYYDKRIRSCKITKVPSNGSRDNIVGSIALFQSITTKRAVSPKTKSKTSPQPGLVLGFFAKVHRGISTGANSFFVLTDQDVKRNGIPMRFLIRIVPPRTGREFIPDIFTEQDWEKLRLMQKQCWMLCLPKELPAHHIPPQIEQYIKSGERQGVHLTPTSMSRKPWYSIRIPPEAPDLLFTYISRKYPRFIQNKARVYNLTNNVLSQKMEEIVNLLNKDLRTWIDTDFAGRNYVGGLIKFEPRNLEKLPVSESLRKCLGIENLNSSLKQK
jgi:hypothetical protein